MKKIIVCLAIASLFFVFLPNEMKAASDPIKTELQFNPVVAKTNLIDRLDEIQMMDKKLLNNSEKRAMRNEVRTMNSSDDMGPGGVYISVGALILIILLLIIIF